MTNPTPRPPGLGLADALKDFDDAAPQPPKARPSNAVLAVLSEQNGFPSREPRPPKGGRKPAPPVKIFDHNYSVRIASADKQRFDDLAYALRVPKGELFRLLLDRYEAGLASRRGEN